MARSIATFVQKIMLRRIEDIFWASYSDRGSHSWLTPTAGEHVDPNRVTQGGTGVARVGIQMVPAYSPQARGPGERNLSTWQGRLPQELRRPGCTTLEAAHRFPSEHSPVRVQSPYFQSPY